MCGGVDLQRDYVAGSEAHSHQAADDRNGLLNVCLNAQKSSGAALSCGRIAICVSSG